MRFKDFLNEALPPGSPSPSVRGTQYLAQYGKQLTAPGQQDIWYQPPNLQAYQSFGGMYQDIRLRPQLFMRQVEDLRGLVNNIMGEIFRVKQQEEYKKQNPHLKLPNAITQFSADPNHETLEYIPSQGLIKGVAELKTIKIGGPEGEGYARPLFDSVTLANFEHWGFITPEITPTKTKGEVRTFTINLNKINEFVKSDFWKSQFWGNVASGADTMLQQASTGGMQLGPSLTFR